jgi:pSer/pThr/pTyr-binding forkhead associated (FHA) protein
MPLTVIVGPDRDSDVRLTFDGMQPVVIGRGASCDVRLPDATVSHRHASLRAQGGDVLLFDEGSTNGTFVGDAPVAPRTSRLVRSGDRVRVGRVWLEVRVEQTPVTRDLPGATRDLALSLVARAMAARGEDGSTRLLVVEGPDQGASLSLREEGRAYLLGRGAHCDLALSDPDASREHARIVWRARTLQVLDLGGRNGTWLGETRLESQSSTAWRPAQALRIGQTVIALEEPVPRALARIEGAPDEPLLAAAAAPGAQTSGSSSASSTASSTATASVESPSTLDPAGAAGASTDGSVEPAAGTRAGEAELSAAAAIAAVADDLAEGSERDGSRARARSRRRSGWTISDFLVGAAALGILVASIAGLVWLLR